MAEGDHPSLDGSDTMFTQFAAGQGRRERRRGTMVVSVAAHAAVAWLAAVATVRGTPGPPEPPPPVLVYHPPRPTPPAPPATRPRTGRPASPGIRTAAPARVAVDRYEPPATSWFPLPEPGAFGDPAAALAAGAGDALATGAEGGTGGGEAGGDPAGGVWAGAEVDVEARARPGNAPPRYPSLLEQQGVGGSVVARFVVDSAGRVEPGSLTIRTSDHPLLGDAVRRALAGYRFLPAQVRGRTVRQLVELPFVFSPRP